MAQDDTHISVLRQDARNARRHSPRNIGMIAASLQEVGAARSIVIDEDDNILAGNGTVDAAAQVGIEKLQIVEADGDTLVAVRRRGLTPRQKKRLALYDNRTAELAEWDGEVLEVLREEGELDGLFYREEVDSLLAALEQERLGEAARDAVQAGRGERPTAPLDLIFTTSSDGHALVCCIATRSGFSYGFQSGLGCCAAEPLSPMHKAIFIDNKYEDYDHELHLDTVRRYRPKYCTVRDIMTAEQCSEAGIAYYSFEQIMEWAAQLEQYAENVIVIPKCDCIADIPSRYVLGYSVPTSYGGTPLPPTRFAGRRVHLLGGSPNKQIAYWREMRAYADVVSLDNNYLFLIAKYGNVWMPDGYTRSLTDLGMGFITNPLYVALAISLGNFAAYFQKEGTPDSQLEPGAGLEMLEEEDQDGFALTFAEGEDAEAEHEYALSRDSRARA